MTIPKLYDVVGVSRTHKVRVVATGKTLRNAEAVVMLAVVRHSPGPQGMERAPEDYEFFIEVPAGTYRDGDQYAGTETS